MVQMLDMETPSALLLFVFTILTWARLFECSPPESVLSPDKLPDDAYPGSDNWLPWQTCGGTTVGRKFQLRALKPEGVDASFRYVKGLVQLKMGCGELGTSAPASDEKFVTEGYTWTGNTNVSPMHECDENKYLFSVNFATQLFQTSVFNYVAAVGLEMRCKEISGGGVQTLNAVLNIGSNNPISWSGDKDCPEGSFINSFRAKRATTGDLQFKLYMFQFGCNA